MLYIQFSGGMGVSYQGVVDLSSLPPELLARAEDLLSEQSLRAMSKLGQDEASIDSMIYEIKLHHSSARFSVSEAQADDVFLELMDELADYLTIVKKNDG
ncbi:MAG: hypothetical protein GKR96_09135 [Gammaproteobacteria bacterium]|nr:hypothetical protein [Gammaproteobacteria bacterium]